MTTKKIIASIVGTFSIAVLFIILFMIYGILIDSPLAENPQSQVVLEQGREATVIAFNWWLVINVIGGIILFTGIIFGIIKLIMKIVENETSVGFGSSFY